MPDQPIHALVIDAGPLITSTSTASLLSRAQKVYTTPSVIAEIRDAATRSRLETTWLPFLQQRTPGAESVKIVSEFAKKTGDFIALSVTDLQLLALTYELEVEENKGDWRLRRAPGQKGVNGPVPEKEKAKGEVRSEKEGVGVGVGSERMKDIIKGEKKEGGGEVKDEKKEEGGKKRVRRKRGRGKRNSAQGEASREVKNEGEATVEVEKDEKELKGEDVIKEAKGGVIELKENINRETKEEVKEEMNEEVKEEIREDATKEEIQKQQIQEQIIMEEVNEITTKETPKAESNAEKITESPEQTPTPTSTVQKEPSQRVTPEEVEGEEVEGEGEDEESSSYNSDNEGWITAENICDYKAKGTRTPTHSSTSPKNLWPIAAALSTTDFAMQNVLLQMNLHLVSPNDLQRIHEVKTWVLRCHACFKVCRDMNKQFCPSCGGATLLRTSCSTDSQGVFRVHLKKNKQWSNRGCVYPIPKTQHGSASGKGVKKNLILREDQVEYQREVRQKERQKERDLLDPDYLPGILTGERRDTIGARPKIGYGRVNPNERKGGRSKR